MTQGVIFESSTIGSCLEVILEEDEDEYKYYAVDGSYFYTIWKDKHSESCDEARKVDVEDMCKELEYFKSKYGEQPPQFGYPPPD